MTSPTTSIVRRPAEVDRAPEGLMDVEGFKFVAHTDLDGHGATMGLSVRGDHVYVAHTKGDSLATSVVDLADPAHPRVVHQILRSPGTVSHKAIAVGDVLLQSCERQVVWEGPPFVRPSGGADEWVAGLRIFDVGIDPEQPKEIGFFETSASGSIECRVPELPLVFVTGSDEGTPTSSCGSSISPTRANRSRSAGGGTPACTRRQGNAPDSHRGDGTPCIMPSPTATCCTARGGMPGW